MSLPPLYPTPQRLRLLQACADGQVQRSEYSGWAIHSGGRVTSVIREMLAAGWVVLDTHVERGQRTVHPTDEGRRVLAEAGERS